MRARRAHADGRRASGRRQAAGGGTRPPSISSPTLGRAGAVVVPPPLAAAALSQSTRAAALPPARDKSSTRAAAVHHRERLFDTDTQREDIERPKMFKAGEKALHLDRFDSKQTEVRRTHEASMEIDKPKQKQIISEQGRVEETEN